MNGTGDTIRRCLVCGTDFRLGCGHMCIGSGAQISEKLDPITAIDLKLTEALKLLNDARWMLSELERKK